MKLEIGSYYDKIRNSEVPCVVVDGKPYCWGILPDSLANVKKIIDKDPTVRDAIMMDIQGNFLKGLSKLAGKQVTMKEVNQALDGELLCP